MPRDFLMQEQPEGNQPKDYLSQPQSYGLHMQDALKSLLSHATPTTGVNIASGLMSMAFPQQQKNMIENLPQVLTQKQPGYSEKIAQEIGKFLPGLESGAEAAPMLAKPLQKVTSPLVATNSSIKNTILNTHDTLENKAMSGFKNVLEEVKKRDVPPVKMGSKTMDIIEDYFPKTKSARKLLDRAREGQYESLRKVQTDLYTKAKKNLESPLETDRLRGEEMLEKRDIINKNISNHLKKTWNKDLADQLDVARNDWRQLQDVYYNKNLNNRIVEMVNSETRKIPKNLSEILQEESRPMEKLREFHPGLNAALKGQKYRNLIASNLMKYAGIPLLAGAGLYGGYNIARNY